MARISKPPEVRRQEILDTAMELFAEKGYEDTSMADIARRMGVVQGLCYRYFDSKRVLFREAMEQYVRECCAAGLPIIHDRSRTIRQRLDDMAALTLETEQNARYHAFYHRPENQSIHEAHLRLSDAPCGGGAGGRLSTGRAAPGASGPGGQLSAPRADRPAGGTCGAPGGAGGAPPALCRPDSGAGILNNASEARGRASEEKNFHSNEQNSMNKIQ